MRIRFYKHILISALLLSNWFDVCCASSVIVFSGQRAFYKNKKESNIKSKIEEWSCVDSLINADKQYSKSKVKRIQSVYLFYTPKERDTLSVVINVDRFLFQHENFRTEIMDKAYVDWLTIMETDSLKAYFIANRYIILTSIVKEQTGMMTSFTQYLIIDIDSKKCFPSKSLCEIPIAYQKGKYAFFVTIKFSEQFIHYGDWDNITYDIIVNEINNGALLQKENRKNMMCN